jgi:hypothetical protein
MCKYATAWDISWYQLPIYIDFVNMVSMNSCDLGWFRRNVISSSEVSVLDMDGDVLLRHVIWSVQSKSMKTVKEENAKNSLMRSQNINAPIIRNRINNCIIY